MAKLSVTRIICVSLSMDILSVQNIGIIPQLFARVTRTFHNNPRTAMCFVHSGLDCYAICYVVEFFLLCNKLGIGPDYCVIECINEHYIHFRYYILFFLAKLSNHQPVLVTFQG